MRVITVIDNAGLSNYQKWAIFLCVMLGCADGINSLSMGYAIPSLAKHFGIAAAAFSIAIIVELIGQMVGLILLAPIADRVGRLALIRIGIIVFSVGAMATYFVPSLATLSICRFVAGVGIGAAVPNIFALAAEYAPTHRKSTVSAIVLLGITGGGMFTGLLATGIVSAYGGAMLMVLAGVVPLVILLLTWPFLPESVEFLASKGRDADVARIVARIDPTQHHDHYEGPLAVPGAPVAALFRQGRAGRTIVIWIMMFCGLFNSYYIFSWLPTFLTSGGAPENVALLAGSLSTLGGMIGGVGLGYLMDKTRIGIGITVIGPIVAIVALLLMVWNLSGPKNDAASLWLSVFLGLGVLGATSCAQVISTNAYPVAIRATGLGWASGVSRIGGLLAPAIGGALLAAHSSTSTLLLWSIIPIVGIALTLVFYRIRFGNISDTDEDHLAAEPTIDEVAV
ncbi:MFS transporter [Nocardia alni]|uniref:MFS transporter n=1 Tax=Nocardia alni TaxID=2815723 RepID=UPI001C2313FF|nr:MFS transporter [Nocardia alni]